MFARPGSAGSAATIEFVDALHVSRPDIVVPAGAVYGRVLLGGSGVTAFDNVFVGN